MSPASRWTRQLLGFSALVLAWWAISTPAQAGLGDLVEGALEEVADLPVVTTVPIALPPLPEVTAPPIVLDLPTLRTPGIVLPIVEIDPIVFNPPPVEIVPGLDVPTDAPPAVTVEPLTGTRETHAISQHPVAADIPTPKPDSSNAPIVADRQRPIENRSIEIRLLLIESAPVPANTEVATQASTLAVAVGATSWLDSLEAWLGIDSIADILSIPMQLLTLLLRALFSAGSGLIAPAAILIAVVAGSRRKLLPV